MSWIKSICTTRSILSGPTAYSASVDANSARCQECSAFDRGHLAAQDAELVAKHDDLEVLGTTRADSETGDHGDETVENTGHNWSDRPCFS